MNRLSTPIYIFRLSLCLSFIKYWQRTSIDRTLSLILYPLFKTPGMEFMLAWCDHESYLFRMVNFVLCVWLFLCFIFIFSFAFFTFRFSLCDFLKFFNRNRVLFSEGTETNWTLKFEQVTFGVEFESFVIIEVVG